MKFRPCIDIHNGKVKQIVGSTLKDKGDMAAENFVSERDASYYARLYQNSGLYGGHIILLNPVSSPYYEATKTQAVNALKIYPNGLQAGGGITDKNAMDFLKAGASHVIVTSFVFHDGMLHYENLNKIKAVTGKKHLVLDLSCRKRGDNYYIVTDRWQKYTKLALTSQILDDLAEYCDEFLIHAVDVEGKANGIETELVEMLGSWNGIPITYAGGIGTFEDLEQLREYGKNQLDVTVGSALDLFGGSMPYTQVLEMCDKSNESTIFSRFKKE